MAARKPRKPARPTYLDLAIDIEAAAEELQKLAKALAKVARALR